MVRVVLVEQKREKTVRIALLCRDHNFVSAKILRHGKTVLVVTSTMSNPVSSNNTYPLSPLKVPRKKVSRSHSESHQAQVSKTNKRVKKHTTSRSKGKSEDGGSPPFEVSEASLYVLS